MNSLKMLVISLAVTGLTISAAFAEKGGAPHSDKGMTQSMQERSVQAPERTSGRDESDEMEMESRATEQTREMEEEHEKSGDDMSDQGKEISKEMRERRDERKQIMEESKTQGKKEEPPKGKKPWWKFWESDEEEAAE